MDGLMKRQLKGQTGRPNRHVNLLTCLSAPSLPSDTAGGCWALQTQDADGVQSHQWSRWWEGEMDRAEQRVCSPNQTPCWWVSKQASKLNCYSATMSSEKCLCNLNLNSLLFDLTFNSSSRLFSYTSVTHKQYCVTYTHNNTFVFFFQVTFFWPQPSSLTPAPSIRSFVIFYWVTGSGSWSSVTSLLATT